MPFDFDSAVVAPFRMQPGLRRLDAGALQLTPARPGSAHLDAKLAVLRARPDSALCAVPGFDPRPALRALQAQAAAEHPHTLAVHDVDRFAARHLGWAVDRDVLLDDGGPTAIGECLHALPPPWRAPALLALAFEEDFAIVDGEHATVPWLAVALPSHWAPARKVGRHFAQVHAPVADNHLLLTAGDALMRMVAAPRRWERFVWTVTPRQALAAHPEHAEGAAWPADAATLGDPDTVARRACWRTERQTFIPVPAAGQAVFTIHVQVQPLVQVIDSTDRATRLRDALASMGEAVLAYRSLSAVRAPLLKWLDARTKPAPGDTGMPP